MSGGRVVKDLLTILMFRLRDASSHAQHDIMAKYDISTTFQDKKNSQPVSVTHLFAWHTP
jgi:hypothetical protein